jgi:Flp pilus assembly protein TadD
LIAERKAKSHLARGNEETSEEHFREAAKLFQECGQVLREASCYEALGEFENAGGE